MIDESPPLRKFSSSFAPPVLPASVLLSSLRTRNNRGFSGSQTATQSSGTPFWLSHFGNRDYNICLVLGLWKRISAISISQSNIKKSESEWKHCRERGKVDSPDEGSQLQIRNHFLGHFLKNLVVNNQRAIILSHCSSPASPSWLGPLFAQDRVNLLLATWSSLLPHFQTCCPTLVLKIRSVFKCSSR